MIQTKTCSRRYLLLLIAGGVLYLVSELGKIGQAGDMGVFVPRNNGVEHSVVGHGLADVQTVRNAAIEMIRKNPLLLNRPPCKDGRIRIVMSILKKWGVWVLERNGNALIEVTAFITGSQSYIKGVADECNDDDWLGHSYA